MTNPQCAAAIRRGERHDQRAEHPLGFLGVAVRQKEAAALVHKQLVELGGDTCVFTSQPCIHFRKDDLEVRRPRFSADLDLARSDLPHLADGGINDRLLAPAVRCPFRPPQNRRDLGVGYRKRKRSGAFDIHPRHRHLHRAADEKVTRPLHARQNSFKRPQLLVVFDLNVLQCGLHGRSHTPNCDYETKRLLMRAGRPGSQDQGAACSLQALLHSLAAPISEPFGRFLHVRPRARTASALPNAS